MMKREYCHCDCFGGFSVFVIRKRHVRLIFKFLNEDEKLKSCVHKYDNGYLVYFPYPSTWTVVHLVLEDKGIFHQQF
jgi:hypothetical protein